MSDFLLLKLWHQGTVATKLDRASLVYLPAINPLISEVHRCHGDAPDFLPIIRGILADIKYWN